VRRGENNKQTTVTHSLSLSFLGAERESGEMAFMLSRQRAEDGAEEEEAAASAERKRGRPNCIVVIFRNTLMQHEERGVVGGEVEQQVTAVRKRDRQIERAEET